MGEFLPNPSATTAANGELFLSYNSQDRDEVRLFREILKTKGIGVFLDREQLIFYGPSVPSRLALLLVNLGMTQTARPYINKATESIGSVSRDEERSRAFANLAETLVRIGDYESARRHADSASLSADKLRAYTAILGQFVRERYPKNALLVAETERTRRDRSRRPVP